MAKDKTTDYYRICFGTAEGKRVLANLLVEARFFEHIKTYEELAVENFVKTILNKCGAYDVRNVNYYIDGLFRLPIRS